MGIHKWLRHCNGVPITSLGPISSTINDTVFESYQTNLLALLVYDDEILSDGSSKKGL